MRSIFNERALEIFKSVLSFIPLQSRILMRQVLNLHTGSFHCSSYAEAKRRSSDPTRLLIELDATPEQLRRFVGLAHRTHATAHLCMDNCIQQCLESCSLGRGELRNSLKLPTWTEEQRTILAFWRVLYYNELRKACQEGRLDFSADGSPSSHFTEPTAQYQAVTSLQMFWKLSTLYVPEDYYCQKFAFGCSTPFPFDMPSLPQGSEFGWICQPPPSRSAVVQGWNLANEPHVRTELTTVSARRFFHGTDSDSDSDSESQLSQEGWGLLHESRSSDIELSGNEQSEMEESGREESESKEISPETSPMLGPSVSLNPAIHRHIPKVHPRKLRQIPKRAMCIHDKEWRDLNERTLGVQFWQTLNENP